jgi:predicted negative regulator of RcsB-dependent stress response
MAHTRLGRVLAQQKKCDDAVKHLHEAIAQQPDSAWAN